jgi:adenylate kinase
MTLATANTASPVRVIELAGLPGTGKSTIARCLEDMLRRAGVPTSSRAVEFAAQRPFMHRQRKRLQLIARHSKRCGHLYRRSFRLIAESSQRSISDFASVTSNLWGVLALMAEGRADDDRVMILDQGLVQAIWSVQLTSLRALSFDAWGPLLLSAGIAETLLVHVQTDIAVSRHRVAARDRNRTRLDYGNCDERSRRWQIASEDMSDLIEWVRSTMPHDQHGGRVLSVTNHEGAPEAAAAEIASAYFSRTALRACA